MPPSAKMRCDKCDAWLPVETKTDHVHCECGAVFAVTITQITAPSA